MITKSKPIVVVGSSNVDFTMKMERLPKVGESVTDAQFMQTYGGKGANQAVGAVRAGGNVYFINCVGDDNFTVSMLENYQNDGINIDYVFKEEGISSGTALIMAGESGDNYLSVAPGANYKLTPERIDQTGDLIKEAGIIILQYEIPAETIKCVIDKANENNIPVLWNFAPARKFDFSYFKKINTLVVNESEAEFITGNKIESIGDARVEACKILEKGPKNVIITLGKAGSYLLNEKEEIVIPAFNVKAVDTTAAGDIFCGAFAVGIVEGKPVKEALRFATAASAISVCKMGAQPSAPYREDIENFLEEHKIIKGGRF